MPGEYIKLLTCFNLILKLSKLSTPHLAVGNHQSTQVLQRHYYALPEKNKGETLGTPKRKRTLGIYVGAGALPLIRTSGVGLKPL